MSIAKNVYTSTARSEGAEDLASRWLYRASRRILGTGLLAARPLAGSFDEETSYVWTLCRAALSPRYRRNRH
jgi:hypothetical protein